MPFLFAAAQEAAASSTPDGSLCEPHLDPNLALFPNTSKQKKKLRKGIWCISRSFQTAVGLQKEIMPTSKRPVKNKITKSSLGLGSQTETSTALFSPSLFVRTFSTGVS